MPEFRRLTSTDLEAFKSLRLTSLQENPKAYFETFEEESTLPHYHAHLITNSIIMGAFIEGELVGYTILSPYQHPKVQHKGSVWGAYVKPDFRNMNLGKQMRLRLFGVAKRLGMKSCISGIMKSNPAALAVHKSVGYVEMYHEKDAIRHIDGSFDDLIHLVKYL